MKHLTTLIAVLIFGSALSQNFEDQWSAFFSYVSVKDISQGNDRIYAASQNAVFAFDLSTEQFNTISTVNGLSGEEISALYYSESFDLLVIGYENGLMEVVTDGDEDVLTVVDILDKPTIPPNTKRINDFFEYNGNLYIAAEFGISVFDLAALEFGDTYFIGPGGIQLDVTQVAVVEPYIYAATRGNGVRRAEVANTNLIDFNQWINVQGGGYKHLQNIGNEVYAVRLNDIVYRSVDGGPFQQIDVYTKPVIDLNGFNGVLTVCTATSIDAYTAGYSRVASVTNLPGFDYELQSGLSFNNNLYMGTTELGMLRVPFGSSSPTQILPDGPIRNDPFAIDASPGQLWVTFGNVDVSFNPFPQDFHGISNLREGQWTNIPFDNLFGASDLVDVTINPNDPNEVYITSYLKGLLRIDDQTPSILYDETNSSLEIPNGNTGIGIRIYGSDFDRDGNLWITQSRTDEGLIRVSPGGQFDNIDLSSINAANEQALSEIKISRQGLIFFGSAENGLVGYDPSTGNINRIGEGIGSGNLPSVQVRALEFDANNRLWIGTLEGLRVLFNVAGFFEEGVDVDASEIIILENGVPQELLFGQTITDIEVDGSNNKWIATATSGVFYLSPNGQETLLRFTKDNSPLPSNNVQDITIDNFTGRVYFGTINGLVSYDGTATAPRENLENVYAFPNPVRPGFTGNVTIDGLTANANVKITDIEGNLVFEDTSQGGSVLWDTTAFGRYRVASGVYLVLVTTEDALETTVSKIMIVR